MAPSRRRGPSGKTSATAARSAAIQAAEKRRREEQEHNNNSSSNTNTNTNNSHNNNNNHNDDENENETSTAKGVHVGYDAYINLESTNNNNEHDYEHDYEYEYEHNNNNNNNNNNTALEVGKKRKKFSLLPPFAADVGTATTTSTASSSITKQQQVQLHHTQPYCKVVPEDLHHKSICTQRSSRYGKMVYKRKQDFDYSKGGVDDEDDDDDQQDEGCLHCHEKVKNMPRISVIDDDEDDNNDNDNDSNNDDEGYSGNDSNIQVRCDDCRGYICNGCHWCHEFQANHEIRVCDRCDAFYCRGCDEMDQCDDCGEVVCGSCSTLLSCKFCGGGLCEECATACGRCGIVLCSRDAKFAVDCDTCRLSYCLVCLASGSKDPCVRCGHRPSKRMEQLVHLRLKSIYKAFKSSSGNNSVGGPNSGGGGNYTNSNANTIGAHSGSRGNSDNYHSSSNNNNNNKIDGPGGRSRRNKPTTLQDMVGDHDDEYDGGVDPAMSMMMGAAAGVLPHKFCHDLEQNYLAEQKKADAAADALLAELEEEETAIAQKKSKKKKKKDRKNAGKQPPPAETKGNSSSSGSHGEKNDGDVVAKNKMSWNDRALLYSRDDEGNADPLSETSETDSIDQATTKANDEANSKMKKAQETKIDPIEKELVECVNNFDLDGIDHILFRLKGIPGRAALRKNAKKALKRLKLELNPPSPTQPEPKVEVSTKPERKTKAAIDQQMASKMPKVYPVAADSRTSSKKTTIKSTSTSHEKSSTKASHPKQSNRCEAMVEIVSRLVGWMIGKNGQRIRDLMEESGAKIWIDQEKFKGQETRNVYISGDRESVDQAVLLVNDVITNAPPPQGTASVIAIATASVANVAVSMESMAISPKPLETAGKTTGLISPPNTPTAQSALLSTAEVKSAWAKTSGSASLGVDKIKQGMIPKPPTLISSSVVVDTEEAKERPRTKLASESQIIGSVRNEEAPGMLMNVLKTALDVATPAADASIPSNLQHKSAEVTTEIVTCDFRFVPLLIGKRGWTIKNIQDDSGARVDIDQTVTPRQVRISGSKANVDKAVTMVRDVLSYPHAQLQSSSEGMVNDESGVLPELGPDMQLSEAPVPVSTPTKQKLLAASAALEHDVIRNTMSRQREISDRIHSPPPLVGDAKSAISASSSLSSTPEPSMASSSKGFIASHLQNGPLLPPPAEHYAMGSAQSQPVSGQFLQSEGGLIDGVDARGLWASAGVGAPQPSYTDSSGQIDFRGGRPIDMPHGAPSHPQMHHLHQQGQHLQMNTAMLHEQQYPQGNPNHHQHSIPQSFAPTGQISHRIPLRANTNGSPIDRNSQFINQNIGNNQQNRNMHSSLGGAPPYNLYDNDGVPAARTMPTTPLRDLMHPGGSPTRGSGFADSGSGLWNTGNPTYSSSGLPPQTSGLQPRSSSGFAATSMGFPSGHHQRSNETGMTNPLVYTNSQAILSQQALPNTNSLSMAANNTASFPGSIPSGLRNDDSLMIDSLFGGGTNVQSSNVAATDGLLAGFHGLSLPSEADGAKSSGLWGSSDLTETWHDNKGSAMNNRGSDGPNVSSIGNLFSTNEILSQDHPQESRFNWDSTNANR